jgi:hypothetical protein
VTCDENINHKKQKRGKGEEEEFEVDNPVVSFAGKVLADFPPRKEINLFPLFPSAFPLPPKQA